LEKEKSAGKKERRNKHGVNKASARCQKHQLYCPISEWMRRKKGLKGGRLGEEKRLNEEGILLARSVREKQTSKRKAWTVPKRRGHCTTSWAKKNFRGKEKGCRKTSKGQGRDQGKAGVSFKR